LSALVDFGTLKSKLRQNGKATNTNTNTNTHKHNKHKHTHTQHTHIANVNCYGTITQQHLLEQLGIRERVSMLLKIASREEGETLITGLNRLISPKEMGRTYKAFTFTHKSLPKPHGF